MSEETLFNEALAKSSAERAAFLDAACAGQPDLRAAVEALLAAHERSDNVLDKPPVAPGQTVDSDPDPVRPVVTGASPQVITTDHHPKAEPGAIIAGRYTLQEMIGEGGMGEVWVAKQTEPVKRKVALKLIKAGMDTKAVLQRFDAERQALAMMDHPNIAKVLDGGMTADRRPFFVMELVNGLALTKFCDEAKLGIRERLELFAAICQAVQHAHQKGIIHRDLKPSNILVTLIDARPVPKVIDFGVAKAIGGKLLDESFSTQFGAAVGTLEYMSPEQAAFSGSDIDTRADIYSLGVILYELLTGLRPIDSKRLKKAALAEMVRIIQEEEPSKPSTRLSTDESLPSLAASRQIEPKKLMALLRGELDWVVMKALEKHRERRYETANGLARDIQRYLADEPVEARPPSFGYRASKFLRRNKGPVLAASLVLLALLAGIAGTTWGLLKALDAERLARAEEAKVRAERDEKEKAWAEAVQNLAVSGALCDFLQNDLLGQATLLRQPRDGQGRDPDVKVRTLLDRAAVKIDRKFQGQPVLEGAIRWTIGSTYVHLGRYAEAEPQLLRAEQLFTQSQSADHSNNLDCNMTLGYLYYLQGRHAQAEPRLRQGYATAVRTLGSDHHKTIQATQLLALLYMDQSQLSKAEPLLTSVLQTITRLHGPRHPETIACMRGLTRLYYHQERFAESLPLEREIVAFFASTKGPDDPQTLVALNDLAVTYQNLKRYDEAEELYHRVIKLQGARIGPDHPFTLTSKHCLGVLYHDRGLYDRAIGTFEEALKGWQTQPAGSQHRNMYNTAFDLAHNYRLAGCLADAVRLLDEWQPRARAALGASHPYTLRGLRLLSDALRQDRQFARAIPLSQELLDRERARTPPSPVDLATALQQHGQNLLDSGRSADAEPLLRECLAIRENVQLDAWATFNTKSLLGGALLSQKKYADAGPLLLAGYEGLKKRQDKIPANNKVRIPEAIERLVQLCEATNQKDNAAKWRKKLEVAKAGPKKVEKEP